LLVNHFLNKYSHETTKRVDHINNDAMTLLKQYNWPGNVRELENAIERAVVLSKSRTLGVADLSFLQASQALPGKRLSLLEMEKVYVKEILRECGWNITQAAKMLEINRVTLHKKIKRFKLEKQSIASRSQSPSDDSI
jgi:two-component system response regulator HydG